MKRKAITAPQGGPLIDYANAPETLEVKLEMQMNSWAKFVDRLSKGIFLGEVG